MKRARYGNTPGSSRKRTCIGKRKFPTHGAAHAAMMTYRERKGIVAETRVYACRICGGFHWGHARGAMINRAERIRKAIDAALARDATKRGGDA